MPNVRNHLFRFGNEPEYEVLLAVVLLSSEVQAKTAKVNPQSARRSVTVEELHAFFGREQTPHPSIDAAHWRNYGNLRGAIWRLRRARVLHSSYGSLSITNASIQALADRTLFDDEGRTRRHAA